MEADLRYPCFRISAVIHRVGRPNAMYDDNFHFSHVPAVRKKCSHPEFDVELNFKNSCIFSFFIFLKLAEKVRVCCNYQLRLDQPLLDNYFFT